MYFADIVIFSIEEILDNITNMANIGHICRFCYILSDFITTIHLPIVPIVKFSGSLVCSIFLCKVTAARERQVPFH